MVSSSLPIRRASPALVISPIFLDPRTQSSPSFHYLGTRYLLTWSYTVADALLKTYKACKENGYALVGSVMAPRTKYQHRNLWRLSLCGWNLSLYKAMASMLVGLASCDAIGRKI